MTNQNTNTPSHFVYTIQEGAQDKPDYWTKIGAAFAHQDGKGLQIMLDALPLDGRLTLRVPQPKDDQPAQRDNRRNRR